MGDTLAVAAELRSESGRIVSGSVDWISRDERILTVSAIGVQAVRPGFTYLVARAGNAVDSVGVVVRTFRCSPGHVVLSLTNGFDGTIILQGRTRYAEAGIGPSTPFSWRTCVLWFRDHLWTAPGHDVRRGRVHQRLGRFSGWHM